MMVNFSQPQTTHITTTTISDQKQEGNPIHQQHIQQNQLYYMSHHLVDNSYNDSNNINNNSTHKNHLESNNYSTTPCFYYLQEESLEDLERECRRCTQLEIMSSNEQSNHSNRTNLTLVPTQTTHMIKPIIIERHGILPLSDSNLNTTTFGKLRNNTNSNRGIMITTQTTSEPLSTSPHHPNTQHEQSVLPNLHLSNNNPLIFQNTNQQQFQMHPPLIITNALSDSNLVSATHTGTTNSYVDHVVDHQQQQQHGVVNHAFGGQVSNNSLNSYDTTNGVGGGAGVGNAQSLNTMIVNPSSAILQDVDTFSELLLTDLDDDFLQSPTINKNNTNYASYVGGQVSSTSTPEDAPPTKLLFETKTKRQKKRGKLPVHVEIPPPLLAPNQPNVISPQQTIHSSNLLMSGANPNSNQIRKKKTGKNKRKQSVASSSSMASSAATTNTTIGGGSSSTGNGQSDYNFYYGANQSVGGGSGSGSSAMNMLPMFPHTNFHLDGSGPDEESGAAPRRKRGRPPTVHTWSFGIGENTYNAFTRFNNTIEQANIVNSSNSSPSSTDSQSSKKKKENKKPNK